MTFVLPENFKPITRQDIFNAAWQAFVVEKKPPAQESYFHERNHGLEYRCRYKTEGPEPKRCAIGLTIPEGHPYENLKMAFGDLLLHDFECRKLVDPEEPAIFDKELVDTAVEDRHFQWKCDDFQSLLHDGLVYQGEWNVSPETIELTYRSVAKQFNLTIPGEEV